MGVWRVTSLVDSWNGIKFCCLLSFDSLLVVLQDRVALFHSTPSSFRFLSRSLLVCRGGYTYWGLI